MTNDGDVDATERAPTVFPAGRVERPESVPGAPALAGSGGQARKLAVAVYGRVFGLFYFEGDGGRRLHRFRDVLARAPLDAQRRVTLPMMGVCSAGWEGRVSGDSRRLGPTERNPLGDVASVRAELREIS